VSTTFEVYITPKSIIPSYESVLSLSNHYLAETLRCHNIVQSFSIDVEVRKVKTNETANFDKLNSVRWLTDEYAWFYVSGHAGGCDAYCNGVEESDYDRWNHEFETSEISRKIEPYMRECLTSGFYWSFRRSAGQPPIIDLSYGLVAAAFAELTNGFIFSDDGAWDYAMLPATSRQFLQNYFNPSYPVLEQAEWARRCIEIIKNSDKT